MLILYIVSIFLIFESANAEELGQIVPSENGSNKMRFFTGDLDIEIGEQLKVRNSAGTRDMTIEVVAVEKPYAEAEVINLDLTRTRVIETRQSKRTVALLVEPHEIYRTYFFVGPSSSEKFGEFGGVNYGLGLGFSGTFKSYKPLSWSLIFQADDLGEDAIRVGKRVSYYMIGLGQNWGRFSYFVHLGVADNMTMPPDGGVTTDPSTGASYPDNVLHKSTLGYLVTLKYHYPLRKVSRNSSLGWGVGPYLSAGGSFDTQAYRSTVTVGLSVDLENVM